MARLLAPLAIVAVAGGCAPSLTVPASPPLAAQSGAPPSPQLSAEQSTALFDLVAAQFSSQPSVLLTPSSSGREQLAQLAALDPAQLDRTRRGKLITLLFEAGLAQQQLEGASAARNNRDWWQWRSELDSAQQQRLDTLEADYLIAIGELSDGVTLLMDSVERPYPAVANRVWELLNSQPSPLLAALANEAAASLRQLASLALQLRTSEGDYRAQLGQLERWLALYPRHPLVRNRPDYFIALRDQRRDSAPIAVVLSSDGEGSSGALTDGLLERYYQLAASQPLPPLQFYHIGAEDSYRDLYQQLRANGIGRVIGPLRRSQLDRLAAELLEQADQPAPIANLDGDSPPAGQPSRAGAIALLPTLALNERSADAPLAATAAASLSQLPLAVEHELEQLLERAQARSARRILVLAPGSGWGARGARWLQHHWLASGGELAVSYYTGTERDYTPLLQAPLALDASRERSRGLERLTGLNFDSRPRRRQDIDLIILLAQPEQGRQIRPALDFNFAADLPVFATSHIYPGDDRYNRDLAGIEFPASVWQLREQNPEATRGQLSTTVSRQLGALGGDALLVSLREAQLGRVDAPLYGSSGVLLASSGNYRRLGLWHQITERGTVAIAAAARDRQAARSAASGTGH